MPRRATSFVLDPDLESFIESQVASGTYRSASEVMRAALRQMAEDARKEQWLRKALDAGEASPTAPDGVWERVRARTRTRRAAQKR